MKGEKLRKSEKRTRHLEKEEWLDSLEPGDVVVFKNRGRVVYDGDDKGRMIFYMKGIFNGEIVVWKIARERIGATDGRYLHHHMSHAFGDECLYETPENTSPKYKERKSKLEGLGLMK